MAGSAGVKIFVHPSGDNTFNGRTWANAVATIAAAQTLCTSGRGDTIVIAPHTSAYAAVDITKDYITIDAKVRDSGYARPDITGAMVITGQGFVMRHARHLGGILTIRSNGFYILDCMLEADASDAVLLQGSSTDDGLSASEGKIIGCMIRDSARGIRFKNAGGASGIGPSHVMVMGNVFTNITGEDVLDEDVAGSNDNCFWQCVVDENDHLDQNKAAYITLTAGGANTGKVGGRFNVNTALTSTHVAVASGIDVVRAFDANGLVDTSAF